MFFENLWGSCHWFLVSLIRAQLFDSFFLAFFCMKIWKNKVVRFDKYFVKLLFEDFSGATHFLWKTICYKTDVRKVFSPQCVYIMQVCEMSKYSRKLPNALTKCWFTGSSDNDCNSGDYYCTVTEMHVPTWTILFWSLRGHNHSFGQSLFLYWYWLIQCNNNAFLMVTQTFNVNCTVLMPIAQL